MRGRRIAAHAIAKKQWQAAVYSRISKRLLVAPGGQLALTDNTRAVATQTLLTVLHQGRSLNDALDNSASPLLKELVYGVTRWYWWLNAHAESLLSKPLRQKDADVMVLILVGLYQLIELRVPVHAAINETVNACEQLGKSWSKGLVNAVLRSYLRLPDDSSIEFSDEAKYSHPSWLISLIRDCWPIQWREVLMANNERPPMVIRVNRLRTNRSTYLKEMTRGNLNGTADPLSGDGIILDTPVSVRELPGFFEGLVSVQDTAAQWAASILPVTPNDRILDACAAPGGKLTHILEAHPILGEVVAIDISPTRVKLVKENLQRLGFKAKTLAADAADLPAWWDGQQFDCIVIDAPCTGTGVIRRRPDIKHLRQPGDLHKLVHQQAVLLERLWQTLALDGYLLYITCSILKAENGRQIERFVTSRDDVNVCTLDLPMGVKGMPDHFGLQTLPGVHKVDGFFYSLLRKTAS